MESTYGDRNHTEVWSYTDDLAAIIDETIARGGNVVIPSFAVGRTQELLYFIREIKDAGLVKSDPDFPVYIDSPLAKRATTIFTGDLRGYLDEEALALGAGRHPHVQLLTNLRMTESSEESKALNADPDPQGDHLRLRHVRRGPDPPPPQAQPLAAGVHRGVRGLPGGGHPGPVSLLEGVRAA